MVTDPPYGIELDSEWRDRAGLNGCGPAEASYMKHRTEGHTETSISGTPEPIGPKPSNSCPACRPLTFGMRRSSRAKSSPVCCGSASFITSRSSGTNSAPSDRTLYWFQHEPCWFVRKKNAPWYGKAGENSTIWSCPSPKFIFSGSEEEKFDHPTQKPMECMRRPSSTILSRARPFTIASRIGNDSSRGRADRPYLLRR